MSPKIPSPDPALAAAVAPPAQRRFYYVGDNRNRENWGCRATSAALEGLIQRVGTVSGISDGQEALTSSTTPMIYSPLLPVRTAGVVGRAVRGRRVRRLRSLWSPVLRDDYISESPEESVRNFLRFAPRYPHLRRVLDGIRDADAVVINGEGSLIFCTPPRRDVLFFLTLLKLAQDLGKQTYYVNAMVSDCPRTGRNLRTFQTSTEVLRACTAVSARDSESLALLREMGVPACFIPDALFTWFEDIAQARAAVGARSSIYAPFGAERLLTEPSVDLDQPYICVSGTSAAGWSPTAAVAGYSRLLKTLGQLGVPLLVVPTCAGDQFLYDAAGALGIPRLDTRTPIQVGAAILSKAAVFVSGRFHPSVMASLGGTPCVFLGSNSHKTRSLQAVLGYDRTIVYAAVPTESDCVAITANVAEYLEKGAKLRARISSRAASLANQAQELTTLLGGESPLRDRPTAPHGSGSGATVAQ